MARQKANKAKGASKGRGKRSKAESMTGAKADEAEMRKPELDLQEPIALKSDDFNLHFKSVKSAAEKMATAQSLLRTCYKRAKEVSPDLLDAVKWALKVERADPEDIKRELQVRGFVLKETGHHLQLTLHDSLAGDVGDAAEKRGYTDGKAGRAMNNVYPEKSDLSARYEAGYSKGQAELVNDGMGHNSDGAGPEDEEEPRPDTPAQHDGDAPEPIKEPENEFA